MQATPQSTTHEIASALGESDEKPLGQIGAVVDALGAEAARALLAETLEAERSGGMLLPDGSRRRTPGGVFFFLARKRLSKKDRQRIFPPAHPPKPPAVEGAANAPPPAAKKKSPRVTTIDADALPRPATYVAGPRPARGPSAHDIAAFQAAMAAEPVETGVRRLLSRVAEPERRDLLRRLLAELEPPAPASEAAPAKRRKRRA
jgi:hypothetical protein